MTTTARRPDASDYLNETPEGRHDIEGRRVSATLGRRTAGEAPDVPTAVPTGGTQADAEGRGGSGSVSGTVGESMSGVRRVSDAVGYVGGPGMALSDPAGVAGLRNGLTELAAEPNARGNDLILSPDSDIGHAASPVTRFEANLDAVRLVKKIEAEKRPATAEEKAVIGRFSGWGDSAFNGAFPADLDHYESRRKGKYPDTETAWSRRGDTLRSVTTPDEYKAIALSRINAFYTTPTVINAMWHGLGRMGVNDLAAPRVMEVISYREFWGLIKLRALPIIM